MFSRSAYSIASLNILFSCSSSQLSSNSTHPEYKFSPCLDLPKGGDWTKELLGHFLVLSLQGRTASTSTVFTHRQFCPFFMYLHDPLFLHVKIGSRTQHFNSILTAKERGNCLISIFAQSRIGGMYMGPKKCYFANSGGSLHIYAHLQLPARPGCGPFKQLPIFQAL